MPFHVRDSATHIGVRRLAKLEGKTLSETIREAVEHECQRAQATIPLSKLLKPIQQALRSLSKPGGLPAGEACFDDLSGEP